MNDLPLVSVITPSFNQGRYLQDTLKSVAGQDYPRIEHIVLDGGSTDESVGILKAWATTHPINWRSEPDNGQADAIQRGVEMSSGDIVAWLNSDDTYLAPTVISAAVAEFRNGATVVTGGGWYLAEDGTRLRRIPPRHTRLTHATLRCVDWVLQPATFVGREHMVACPLDTRLHFAFDWDLFIRLSARTTFSSVDDDWAGYRLHANAKTPTGGGGRRRELIEVTRRYHGRSWRYASLRVFDVLCRGADALPGLPGYVASRGLGVVSTLSNDLTNGCGFPFRPAVPER